MGLHNVLHNPNMGLLGIAGLLTFLAMFVGIVVWALTRPRHEIEYQARLPVDEDDR